MKRVKIRICRDMDEAQSLADDLKADADDEGRGLWSLGVSYTEDYEVERTLFVALDHDGTPGGAVMSAARLLQSLGTFRTAVGTLIVELARESFIDAETLELLTAYEIEDLLQDEKEGSPTE